VLANLNAKYGLDQPLWKQVLIYVWGIVPFRFRPCRSSIKDRTVNDHLAQGFPVTLTYGSGAFVVATAWASRGRHRGDPAEHLADYLAVGSIGAQVLPNFVWRRSWCWSSRCGWAGCPAAAGGRPVAIPCHAGHRAFHLLYRLDRADHPVFDAGGADLEPHPHRPRQGPAGVAVILRHALKPAMLPVMSYLGPAFVAMITGSVVVDMYFSTGGIGKAFVDSALNRDYAVMMGITILVGALTILFSLVVDILYAWIDPKIRY
jgi:oligopeptide transport system permease protein